jgi:hypothetical protein
MLVNAELRNESGTHLVAVVHGVHFEPYTTKLPSIIRHHGINYGLFYHPAGNTSDFCPPVYRRSSTQDL